MLDHKGIKIFYRSISYPIGTKPNLYEENQAKTKILFSDRITPQDSPLGFLITAIHEFHLSIFLT